MPLPVIIYYLLHIPPLHYQSICFEAVFTNETHPEEIEDMRKTLVASIVALGMTFSAPAFAGGSHHGGGGAKIGAGLKLGIGVKALTKVKVKIGLRLGVGIGL
jgi:hypothetical protein